MNGKAHRQYGLRAGSQPMVGKATVLFALQTAILHRADLSYDLYKTFQSRSEGAALLCWLNSSDKPRGAKRNSGSIDIFRRKAKI